MNGLGKEYKYDIAFSLCKQDVEFARQLIAQLNPSLNVFFYEHNQEELISQSGPEAFGKVFKEQARIVVILSRKEWGESYYTEIEKNAIIDRTSLRNEGYGFLVVIPLAPNEAPVWYPPTRIYANPQNFTIEQLAKFIEYKVTDEGGNIKQLTLEERYNYLVARIEQKKKVIELQISKEALDEIQVEIKNLQDVVKRKIELFQGSFFRYKQQQTWPIPSFEAYYRVDDCLLEIKLHRPDESYHRIVTTQDYTLFIQLHIVAGHLGNLYDQSENKKLVASQEYKYFYDGSIQGWASPFVRGKQVRQNDKEAMVLFRDTDHNQAQIIYRYYDLKNPASSELLIDSWFQELLKQASHSIEKYV